jgi:hypothetical protein
MGELSQWTSPQTLCTRSTQGLWRRLGHPVVDERLVGALLLGEKLDGSLYTQEDFEIARAVCERLVDTQASAEMARRLMALQRQRLAESQVLDRQARRLLHDDVLPRLHAMLSLAKINSRFTIRPSRPWGAAPPDLGPVAKLPAAPRGVPPGAGWALHSLLEGELKGAFDQVGWQIPPDIEGAEACRLRRGAVYGTSLRNAAGTHRSPGGARWATCASGCMAGRIGLSIEDNGGRLKGRRQPDRRHGQGLTLQRTDSCGQRFALAGEHAWFQPGLL